ncbi:MAG: hypothetical protein GY754_06785 [bacterium]|nr:hypothetical protein [bacterium]
MILGITISISVLFSRQVYHFYIHTWYITIKQHKPEDMMKNARTLLAEKDTTAYKKKEYLKLMLNVFPENYKIKQFAGRSYITLGEEENGAYLILSTIDYINLDDNKENKQGDKSNIDIINYGKIEHHEIEIPDLREAVQVLFKKKLYGDIVGALKRSRLYSDPEILYCYGVSLYKREKYDKAVKQLLKAENNGKTGFEINYYIGLAYEKLNKPVYAVPYLEEARTLYPGDRGVNSSLIRVYKKAGKIKKAEQLIRLQRRWR